MFKALVFVSGRCPYCIYFKRVIEKLKRRFPDISFEFVDIESNPELSEKFEIEILPTTIILNGDDVVGGIMGFVNEKIAEMSLREQLLAIRRKK